MDSSTDQLHREKKARPVHMPAQKCPRCDSLDTKFCYYNNYSLSQPRYYCKSCRRYWTKGGTLRNVPIGGSCRRNKHPSKKSPHHPIPGPAVAQLQKPGRLSGPEDIESFSIYQDQYLRSLGLGPFLDNHPPINMGIQNMYYGLLGNENHSEFGYGDDNIDWLV